MRPTPSSTGRILVVDDIEANRRLLKRLLERDGHTVIEADRGDRAIALARSAEPDVILLDVVMPEMDGFETCSALKAHPATRLTPVVLVTGLREQDHRLRGIHAGADDFLSKPLDAHELSARVQSLVRLKRYTDELDSADAVIVSLALTIEARDPCTDGHCQRLAGYASQLGASLGLNDEEVSALHRGGFLHDVGKVGVPDRVLLKAGPLTAEEFELIKAHTTIGDRLCGELRSLRRVRPIVRHHHEKLDGSGYPDGLEGPDIPLLAQIMGVVDVFDALTTARPYKHALSPGEAFDELYREVALGWRDRELVDRFARLMQDAPAGPAVLPR